MSEIYNFKDVNNQHSPLLGREYIEIINEYGDYFDNLIDYKRDYLIDYFGFKTLERAYLMHLNKIIVERPQHMWLRVAICIHKNDLDAVKESYDFDIYSIDYIIFSGGTTRRMFNNFSKEEVNSDNVEIITKTNIYVNKDDLCPYKGLVYKLAYDKNILKQ